MRALPRPRAPAPADSPAERNRQPALRSQFVTQKLGSQRNRQPTPGRPVNPPFRTPPSVCDARGLQEGCRGHSLADREMPSSTPTLREPISRSPPRPRAAGEPAPVTRGPSGTTTDRRPAFRQPTAAGVAIPEPHRNPRPCHVTKHAPDRPPRGPSRAGCWPRTLGVIDGSRSSRRIRPTSRAWVCPPPGLQRRHTPGIANGLRFSVGARAPHRRRGADRRGIGGRTGWGRLRSGAVDCAVIPPVDCRAG